MWQVLSGQAVYTLAWSATGAPSSKALVGVGPLHASAAYVKASFASTRHAGPSALETEHAASENTPVAKWAVGNQRLPARSAVETISSRSLSHASPPPAAAGPSSFHA